MRYYGLAICATSEHIKNQATVDFRIYSSGKVPEAVNDYMYENLENGLNFFVYREEENAFLSAFSYDETIWTYEAAYEYIRESLRIAFSVKKIKWEPYEVTMFEYLDFLMEGRRREYARGLSYRYAEVAKLWIFNEKDGTHHMQLHFDFKERIAPEKRKKHAIFDEGFLTELNNIKAHKDSPGFNGNMVHYVISARSVEAASDMTEALVQSLIDANRLDSRRMEIVSEIEPDLYEKSNRMEDILENNIGGVVVIDLTEKFGHDPTSYVMTSQFIEKLLKKYRNQCLFVFTYNMDHPGFSYQLLPEIGKYVVPVMLREGRGDRKAAIACMKEMIGNSEYRQYADLAREYMKQFPGNDFSHTDVCMALEQFGAWCMNRNMSGTYSCDPMRTFMMDRDETEQSSYDKLQALVGLEAVKHKLDDIIAADVMEKERRKRKGKDYPSHTMHMIFGGNPGSAKTTVAKLFAKIAKEKFILKSGAFVECGGMDLDGIGCTIDIRNAFTAAKGGVLFIDEAYTIKSDVAITTLLQELENHREEVIVILAGYNERMTEFIERNEGLKSRIPYWVDFPDYSTDELTEIFKVMVKERGFSVTESGIKEAYYIFEKVSCTYNFGNGRYVRNLIENAIQNQSVRLMSKDKDTRELNKTELFKIEKSDIRMPEEEGKKERLCGTAQKELDDMIGLASVKDVIHKALASYKLSRLCVEKGLLREKPSLHMVFTGNPGTAKTTVARLFAEILKDEKVLPTGNFIEVGRADIVGSCIGSTAPLVKKRFREAQGGVLFIDEAYSLCDGVAGGYGDEAINTIVQEMENHRDDVIVIFAGYPTPMKEFLERNPGMRSRIAFEVSFEDYSAEELGAITRLMLKNKEMSITDEALKKLMDCYDRITKTDDFGNGRFVRKTLEEAEMNLAKRIMKYKDKDLTTELLTTIIAEDIPETVEEDKEKRKIGFAA